ncbi:hypothetical protein HYU07_01670 [Candidatus Woesearchaeota archaeon]|nr:hypothetical protein [Candidatus Woesearchaeota archaeon]
MSQNRNKLMDLFIGNISNSVVHRILEKAIDEEVIRKHYDKEFLISLEIAKKYRENINPADMPLPHQDAEYIKEKIIKKVKAELELRIAKGYENINIGLVEPEVDRALKETKVI